MSLPVSVVIGVLAGLVGGARRKAGWSDVLAAGLTLAGLGFVALVASVSSGFFAAVNQLYLLGVVAFPVGAAVLVLGRLIRRNGEGRRVVALIGTAALVAAGLGFWASVIEPQRLQVRTNTLAVTGVESPLVVGVIADLQTPSVGEIELEAVERVLAAEPDLVVLPGDLFQLSPATVPSRYAEFAELLRSLVQAVPAVVIIDGDVDIPNVVAQMAEDAGATFLSDQVASFDVRGQTIHVAGLRTRGGTQREWVSPPVLATLDGFGPDDVVVMLSHPPDPVLALPPGSAVDVLIAGHTHGGQVSIPFYGPPVTFTAVSREAAAGGLSVVNGHNLYVSSGVGMERGDAPEIRFGVPPEVAILTLVPPSS